MLVRERDRERMLLNTEKMEKEKLLKCDLSCFVASNQSRNYSDRSESEFQTRTESIEPQNYSNANSSSSPTPSLTCYSNSIFVAKMKTGGEPKMMTPTPKRRTRLKTLFSAPSVSTLMVSFPLDGLDQIVTDDMKANRYLNKGYV